MARGSQFEIDSVNYLNEEFGNNLLEFINYGGMDSTKPDIDVLVNGVSKFYMEAKMASAQSGQFVVLPNKNNNVFEFSKRNRSNPNEITSSIIEYMNNNFDRFQNAGTSGATINLDSNIFKNWIIEYYKDKGVKYIISSNNNFVIFPVEKYGEYFNITAKYRVKRSGTQRLAKLHHDRATKAIHKLYPNASFEIDTNNQLFTTIKSLTSNIIDLGDFCLYLSQDSGDKYQVKRRSNTNNLNVIFSVKLRKDQCDTDLQIFKRDLSLI